MKSKSLLAVGLALILIQPALGDENWPQWRGPALRGTAEASGMPTSWGAEENIAWKAHLPAWSGGTPIIWGDRVFVTSPSPSPAAAETAEQSPPEQPRQFSRGRSGGRRGFGGFGARRDPGGAQLLLICISKADGSELWRQELDQGNRQWGKQNSSSPSPVTDGEHVWAVTGTGAVAAFDMQGERIWEKNLQEQYGQFGLNWGYASSPLLHEGMLIIEVLHGNNTDDPSYIVAFDASTGKEIWREERDTDARAESPDAYTTPVVLEHDGQVQIVVSGGDYVTGHDPATGREIWRAAGLNPRRADNYRIIGSPVAVDGMIYACTRKTPFLALRAGGQGDVTESHLAWKWEDRGAPDVPTPACDGTHLYLVDDQGIASCVDAKTGEKFWGPQRTGNGTVSASPLLADGKLYITNEQAITTVLAAGPEFKLLATNETDGSYTLSSLAVSGGQLFLRTANYLYCIGSK